MIGFPSTSSRPLKSTVFNHGSLSVCGEIDPDFGHGVEGPGEQLVGEDGVQSSFVALGKAVRRQDGLIGLWSFIDDVLASCNSLI